MPFSRGQVQILYSYLPGAVFPHDDFGFCRTTRVDIDTGITVNKEAVMEVVVDALQLWEEEWRRLGFPEPRAYSIQESDFIIGSPKSVQFVPFPQTLQCQKCGRVYNLQRDLLKLDTVRCANNGCDGQLTQFRFIQAHNCGRIEEVYLGRQGCSIHGKAGLYFDDTGRVRTARWRCKLCGDSEIDRLRQTPCSCQYSDHASNDNDKKLRFYAITDPAIFRVRVAPFINFGREILEPLKSPEIGALVLARTWGVLNKPVKTILEEEKEYKNQVGDKDKLEEAYLEIEKMNPNHPLVLQWRAKQKCGSPGANEIKEVLNLLGFSEAQPIVVSRKLVEHTAIKDSLHITEVQTVVDRLLKRNDSEGVSRILSANTFAADQLGVENLFTIEDFPIGLCSIGYTRVSSKPDDSILVAFPSVEGRTPLYVVVTSTEAIYVQLNPIRVIQWLSLNNIMEIPWVPTEKKEAWAWLYRFVPGLLARRNEPDWSSPAASAIRTLIHSMSHILLRHIEWSGYSPQSLGEYLMPESLSMVLYANRFTDAKVGGLLTLFEQKLDSWLESSFQEGQNCIYDPFCSDEGGACVGCLHREYNCPSYNYELSRAVLYGGPVPFEGNASVPFGPISRGFWMW